MRTSTVRFVVAIAALAPVVAIGQGGVLHSSG